MNTWIFQGNPDKFNIDEYLTKTKDIYWSVTQPKHQNEIKVGDLVYIWRAKGSNNAISGIVAFGVVNEESKPRGEVKNKLFLYDELWKEDFSEASQIKAGIKLKEIRLSPDEGMITSEVFAQDPTLSQSQLIKTRVGSNFLLNETQSLLVEQYWNGLNPNIVEEDEEQIKTKEGRISLRVHKVRERDLKIKKKAIEIFIKQNGSIFCEVCNFSFVEKYGTLGKGFIEVHHLKPISEYDENEFTSIDNLKLVCSNCHRMIHRGDSSELFFELQEKLFKKYS
ncbi:MAG TPA: HNH endonuclease [Ignavibacteriaceae bacterium]|nr:HNH endonuclease [Ignavibacteriaceae bacterium]